MDFLELVKNRYSCRAYKSLGIEREKIDYILDSMAYAGRFRQTDDYRREELIRIIEHSVEKLTLQELEALYYDMSTKNYIND